MKILLVKPPFARLLGSDAYLSYPMGLMSIAARLRQRGHDVAIYDDDVSNPEPIPSGGTEIRLREAAVAEEAWLAPLAQVVDDFAPDVVGVGYRTVDADAAHTIAGFLRERGIRTVAGGIHPSLLPQEEILVFDTVVVGEGDGGNAVVPFENPMHGIITMEAQDDWGEVGLARDAVIGGERYVRYLRELIEVQRGCPYQCAYCAAPTVFGPRVRARDPEDVCAEIRAEGMTSGRLIADSFGANRDYALALCEQLAETGYTWNCTMAIQNADLEMLTAAKAGGCYCINAGIESAVPRWQELSGKRVAPGAPERLLEDAAAVGVGVGFFFMIGWPGETEEELWQTLDYAQTLKAAGATMCISVVTAYPKTRLWELAYGDGKRTPPPWSEFLHQSAGMGFADVPKQAWEAVLEEANDANRKPAR